MKRRKTRIATPDGMLTSSQACDKLGCSLRTLWRWINIGRIPKDAIYRAPGGTFFREAELNKFLEGGGRK